MQKDRFVPQAQGTIETLGFWSRMPPAIASIGQSSRSSFVPPSLRYGAAFSLRARQSAAIIASDARPCRLPVIHDQGLALGHFLHRILHTFPAKATQLDTAVRHVLHSEGGHLVDEYGGHLK
jgi:hypothetical protein